MWYSGGLKTMDERREIEGTFLRHQACPECGSSDGLAVYSSNTGYCFVCGQYFKNIDGGDPISNTSLPTGNLLTGIQYVDLRYRKITKATCQKYGYGIVDLGDITYQVSTYRSKGTPVAQHLRDSDKNFRWLGDTKDLELFGQHLFGTGKRLVITEGELDCLSVSQAFNNSWPVVSVPNGAQSAAKYIKHNIEWIEGFDEVVLWFDNDDPGNKAVEAVVPLITPGKLKVVHSESKDANDLLKQSGTKAVASAVFNAQPYRPDGIVSGLELTASQLRSPVVGQCYNSGYAGLDAMLRGLRKHELTTIGAGSGVGKSTFVRELAYRLVRDNSLRIGYLAFEESVQKSALGILGIHNNIPIGNLILEPESVTDEQISSTKEILDNFYFYDHFGSMAPDSLLSNIGYMAKSLDVDFVVIDHLSIIISGIADGDERRLIDNTMTELRSLVENTGVGVILVSHLRQPHNSEKGHEEGMRVTLNQFRGSGAIKQLSDNVIGLERNQQDPESKDLVTIRVLKNRLFGDTGEADYLRYNRDTGRLECLGDSSPF